MVPSDKGAPRKMALPSWLIFGVLGLAATAGGVFLPRTLRSGDVPVETAPALTPAARVDNPLEYNPPTMPDLPAPGAMFLRLGLGTVVVLVLCVLTLWGGKRWIRPLAGAPAENQQLRILEALPLGGRCSVYLLQAGDVRVLAGVDGAGLKTLLTLPQSFDATLAEVREATGAKAA
jgi:flagellar biogenesis protein FliO